MWGDSLNKNKSRALQRTADGFTHDAIQKTSVNV